MCGLALGVSKLWVWLWSNSKEVKKVPVAVILMWAGVRN